MSGHATSHPSAKQSGTLALIALITLAFLTRQPAVYASSPVQVLPACSQQALVKAIDRGGTIQIGTLCDLNLAGPDGGSAITIPKGDTVDIEATVQGVNFANNSSGGTNGAHGFRSFMVDGSLTLQGISITGGTLAGAAGRPGQPGQAAQGEAFYVATTGRLDLVNASIVSANVLGGAGGNTTGKPGDRGARRSSTAGRAQGGPGFSALRGGSGGAADGGAIYNAGLTDVIDCKFNGNGATGGNGGSSTGGTGGAGGSSEVSGRSYRGGSGGSGGSSAGGGTGGVARGSVIFNAGTVTIAGSSFGNSSSVGGNGGSSTGGSGGSGGDGILGDAGGDGGPGGRSGAGGQGGSAEGGVVYNQAAARILDSSFTGNNSAVGGTGGATTGGAGGSGGTGGFGRTDHDGGRGGAGGGAGFALAGGTGGAAYAAVVFSTGSQSFAGVATNGNVIQGGYGGRG